MRPLLGIAFARCSRNIRKTALAYILGVFGLMCIFIPIIGPVALLLGCWARSDIRRSKGRLKGKGLALLGIILGAFSMIAWLGAYLMPISTVVFRGQDTF